MGLKPDYGGMTVNERLFEAGLLDQFDGAIRQSDRVKMIECLVSVDIETAAAEKIADEVLANPRRYSGL